MKQDIQNRADIEIIVNTFYEKVKEDSIIGHFFENIHWDKHLPIMYMFWENILLHKGEYEGNPMQVHQTLHRLQPLSLAHFQRWTQLLFETVDQLFAGEKSELLKQRAQSISTIMQSKIIAPE